jgi:hypothetical protein
MELTTKTTGELLNLDRLTGIALDRGEGLSADDRRRLIAERKLIRAELNRRHAAACN